MKPVKFLAFSCVHAPLQDKAAVAWLLKKVAEYRPDLIIHLGDGHEADSATQWPSEYDWDIQDEWDSHNEFLKSIRDAHGGGRRVFLQGNHDANFNEIGRINKKVRSALQYLDHEEELKKHWEHPVEYVYDRVKGCFRFGQITAGHGWETGQSADEFQSILLGVPYGLFLGGHTHKPTFGRAHRTKDIPLPYWYGNPGCMRDLKPGFVKRKRTHRWGQGIVVGETLEPERARLSRRWEAHLEIFSMGDGDMSPVM